MDKTKKNGILKAAACVFGSTMLMTCVLGGTLAKYASSATVSGADAVTAASWNVTFGDDNSKTDAKFGDFTIEPNTGYNGTSDKVCPGTHGYTVLKVTNSSEVDACLHINNLKGSTDLANTQGLTIYAGTSEKSTLSETELKSLSKSLTGTDDEIQLPKDSDPVYVVLGYNWDYGDHETDSPGGKDALDTAKAGETIIETLNGATIEARQANPTL